MTLGCSCLLRCCLLRHRHATGALHGLDKLPARCRITSSLAIRPEKEVEGFQQRGSRNQHVCQRRQHRIFGLSQAMQSLCWLLAASC